MKLEELKIGIRLAEDIYEERPGGQRVLLFARGQRISSELQLDRLRESGALQVLVSEGSERLELLPDERCSDRVREEFSELRIQMDQARDWDIEAVRSLDDAFQEVRNGARPRLDRLEELTRASLKHVRGNSDIAMAIRGLRSRQPYIYRHTLSVCSLLQQHALHRDPEISDERILRYSLAGLLHDVGMMHCSTVNGEDMHKAITEESRLHPDFGLEIVKELAGVPPEVRRAVLEHHERYNGSGFPTGLRGDEIHPLAYMTGICDAFEILISERGYRGALSPAVAMTLLQSWADREFPAGLVREFSDCFGRWPVGAAVELDTGERGLVAMRGGIDPLLPVVAVRCEEGIRMVDLGYSRQKIQRGIRMDDAAVGPDEVF